MSQRSATKVQWCYICRPCPGTCSTTVKIMRVWSLQWGFGVPGVYPCVVKSLQGKGIVHPRLNALLDSQRFHCALVVLGTESASVTASSRAFSASSFKKGQDDNSAFWLFLCVLSSYHWEQNRTFRFHGKHLYSLKWKMHSDLNSVRAKCVPSTII